MGDRRGHSGRCLCGAVTYRARDLRDIWFCHCAQCRRATGHFLAACRTERLKYEIAGAVQWSPHSGTAQLGRCTRCASPLFWRQRGSPTMSVLAGSLDHSRGIARAGHAFTGEMGDYYAIGDGLPQFVATPADGF